MACRGGLHCHKSLRTKPLRWPGASCCAPTLEEDPATCACYRAQAARPTTPAAARRRKGVRKGGAVDKHMRLCGLA